MTHHFSHKNVFFRIGIIITAVVMISSMPALAERLSVSVPTANIRSGPGEQHNMLWKIEKYHPLERIRTSGQWFYVKDYEGDKGWIHKPFVSKTPSVIIIKDNSHVRALPNPNAHIVFTAGKSVCFKVTERKNDWIHIEHADGDKGWIHNSLVW